MAQYNKTTQTFAADNKTLHETALLVTRQGSPISGNYYLDIAKGKIPGHSVAFLSGRAENFSTPSTIWNVGGMYPWSAWNGGAAVLYINSTSTDTMNVIINGLDVNWLPVSKVVQLNGTTFVNTGATTFRRVNSVYILDSGAMNAGQINVHVGSTAGTIIARINVGIGQSSMSIYTVPAGHTAFSVFGDFSVNKGEGAELNARWRFFGGGFITVYATEIFQQTYAAFPPVPGGIPEKTDIDNVVQYVTTANGTRVYSNQQLILVDNAYL